MRKQFIALSLGLLLFAVLFQSCEKEETVVSADKQSHSSLRKGEESNPELRLIAFNSLIKEVRSNPEGFEGEEYYYSLDSAVWYIEATMNYTYAYPNNERSALIYDSAFMDINLSPNNGLNIIEIQSKFDETLDILTSKFKSIESEHKFLVSVDYKVITDENENLKLAAFYYFGKFDVYLPDGKWKITGGDYNQGGYTVGPNTTTFFNYDATNKIEQELFYNNYVHEIDVFFTDQYVDAAFGQVLPFNYAPCEASMLYDEYICSTGGCTPLYWLEEDRIDIYIQNTIPAFDYYHNNTGRNFFIEDINWSFDLIPTGVEDYHNYYVFECLGGKMHPRLYTGGQVDFIQ